MHADHSVGFDAISILGNPAYMAPELLKACAGVYGDTDPEQLHLDVVAADWWSVGASLIEAAIGESPMLTDDAMSDSAVSDDEPSQFTLSHLVNLQRHHARLKGERLTALSGIS